MTDFQRFTARFMYVTLAVATALVVLGLVWRGSFPVRYAAAFDDGGYDSETAPGVCASGTCIVRAKPDIAEVRISVRQSSRSATEADSFVKSRISEIISGLKAEGIEEKDIQTEHYRLNSTWKEKFNVMSWTADEALNVRIRDLDKVPQILDGALKAGATGIGNLTYTADNLDELRAQGREKAAAVAKVKAAQLAASLGGKLGKLVSCSETYPGEDGYYGAPYKRLSNVTFSAAMPAMVAEEVLTVQPGELAVMVVVTARYQLN